MVAPCKYLDVGLTHLRAALSKGSISKKCFSIIRKQEFYDASHYFPDCANRFVSYTRTVRYNNHYSAKLSSEGELYIRGKQFLKP
jgi:hypothetical protein